MAFPTNLPPEPTWKTVIRLLRWHKPAGRFILMLPALWTIVLASHSIEPGRRPDTLLISIIILGSLATSAAGCVVNDLWDRNIDPNVERTSDRPLASRTLTVKTGIGVMMVAFLCAGGLSLYLTRLSFGLCVAAIPFIVLYPLAKRFFPVPQLILSLTWGFAVLISWSAVTSSLNSVAWLLWGAVVMWTMGFDTVYAMADRDDDMKVGVHSSALFFGKRAAEAVLAFFVITAILLLKVGSMLQLNAWYIGAVGISIGLWIWQCGQLRSPHPPAKIFGKIFEQNVGIGFIVLLGMILGSTLSQ